MGEYVSNDRRGAASVEVAPSHDSDLRSTSQSFALPHPMTGRENLWHAVRGLGLPRDTPIAVEIGPVEIGWAIAPTTPGAVHFSGRFAAGELSISSLAASSEQVQRLPLVNRGEKSDARPPSAMTLAAVPGVFDSVLRPDQETPTQCKIAGVLTLSENGLNFEVRSAYTEGAAAYWRRAVDAAKEQGASGDSVVTPESLPIRASSYKMSPPFEIKITDAFVPAPHISEPAKDLYRKVADISSEAWATSCFQAFARPDTPSGNLSSFIGLNVNSGVISRQSVSLLTIEAISQWATVYNDTETLKFFASARAAVRQGLDPQRDRDFENMHRANETPYSAAVLTAAAALFGTEHRDAQVARAFHRMTLLVERHCRDHGLGESLGLVEMTSRQIQIWAGMLYEIARPGEWMVNASNFSTAFQTSTSQGIAEKLSAGGRVEDNHVICDAIQDPGWNDPWVLDYFSNPNHAPFRTGSDFAVRLLLNQAL